LDYATEVLLELNIVIDADRLGAPPEQLKQNWRESSDDGSSVYDRVKKRIKDALEAMGYQNLIDECVQNNGVPCDLTS